LLNQGDVKASLFLDATISRNRLLRLLEDLLP